MPWTEQSSWAKGAGSKCCLGDSGFPAPGEAARYQGCCPWVGGGAYPLRGGKGGQGRPALFCLASDVLSSRAVSACFFLFFFLKATSQPPLQLGWSM